MRDNFTARKHYSNKITLFIFTETFNCTCFRVFISFVNGLPLFSVADLLTVLFLIFLWSLLALFAAKFIFLCGLYFLCSQYFILLPYKSEIEF